MDGFVAVGFGAEIERLTHWTQANWTADYIERVFLIDIRDPETERAAVSSLK